MNYRLYYVISDIEELPPEGRLEWSMKMIGTLNSAGDNVASCTLLSPTSRTLADYLPPLLCTFVSLQYSLMGGVDYVIHVLASG